MNLKENELIKLYQSYIQAFARYDIKWVRECYQLPCVLSTPEKVLLLSDEVNFCKEFDAIFTMLKSHNISGFKANNASFQHIDDSLTLVKIDWQFFDGANNLFTEFSAIYHLSYQSQTYKIVNVISHDMCHVGPLEQSLKISIEED